MPSAANPNLEKLASTEAGEPFKQAITMIEHKIRNLEKRKKKIEIYKQEQDAGKTLNADQLEAVKKYDEVLHTLTFSQQLSQQLNILSINHAKQAKKAARREAAERSQQEIVKLRETLLIQDILKELNMNSRLRADLITGACDLPQLAEEEIMSLEKWLPIIAPLRDGPYPLPAATEENSTPDSMVFVDRVHRAAEHLIRVVDSNTRELYGLSYARVKEICQKIIESGYLEHAKEPVNQESHIPPTSINPDLPVPKESFPSSNDPESSRSNLPELSLNSLIIINSRYKYRVKTENSDESISAPPQDEFPTSTNMPGQVTNPGILEVAGPPGICPSTAPTNNPVLQHPPPTAIPPSIPANVSPPQPSSGFVEPDPYYQHTSVHPNTVNRASNNVNPLPSQPPNSSGPPTQFVQPRPLNEVISSVTGTFNFLQESELDPPEISVILPGVAAPVAGSPLPVAAGPIPTQTYTNQSFSQSQPPHPQAPPVAQIHPMVVFQQQQPQQPPSQAPPSQQQQTITITPDNAQQRPIPPKNIVRPLLKEPKTDNEPIDQETTAAVTGTSPPQLQNDDWNENTGDWCQNQEPVQSTGDWNSGNIEEWDNSSSNVQSQNQQESRPARMYRGRGGRGGGRGGGGNNSAGNSNGGQRGGSRGGYQNGRGGYRNNNGEGYYSNQNGYSQGGNGGNYKRGGGGPRGTSRGNGPRGGSGGRGRGGIRGVIKAQN